MVFPPVSYMFLVSRMRTACPAHHALSTSPPKAVDEEHQLWISSLCNFLHLTYGSCTDYRENTSGKFCHCEKSHKITWCTYHIGVTCLVVFNAVRYIHYYVRELEHCSEPLNWKGIAVSGLIKSADIDCPNRVFLEKLLVSHLAKKFVAL
jgi:hypothetical protein